MPIPFACDMTALSGAQRSRHHELAVFLRSALKAVRELPEGYEFEFPLETATYAALTEITPLEHTCCPFFEIAIRLEPDDRLFWQLTGQEGVKQFIQMEFGEWFR
jgi:hypothetical protein